MTILSELKSASTLVDLARVLGYRPSALSFILYKLPVDKKYKKFEIPKKAGGTRQIHAPLEPLKTLQRKLADVLYDCRAEIEGASRRPPLSHGFRRKLSIVTNAKPHTRHRFVLNADIKDFFPSLNFGRVRGFFLKNNDFTLREKITTLIAQIACTPEGLPKGSLCSPVIADLITHLLDIRLAQLSKSHGLTYTRYADDLTFSTNKKSFPEQIARPDMTASDWVLGGSLKKRFKQAGLQINPTKTRMHLRPSRQTVTGLTVNAKVNIPADYYRATRSMCNSVFQRGTWHLPLETGSKEKDGKSPMSSLAPIEGRLSHIYFVKDQFDRRPQKEKRSNPTAIRKLYARFLAYRYFAALDRPLLICEGITDNTYIKAAIRALITTFPELGSIEGTRFSTKLKLFSYAGKTHSLLDLSGGASDLKNLILRYSSAIGKFKHRPMKFPVIILIDNDDGASEVFSAVRSKMKLQIRLLARKISIISGTTYTSSKRWNRARAVNPILKNALRRVCLRQK